MSSEIYRRDIRYRQRGIGFGSPSAGFVEIGHLEFIHPHDTVLCRRRIIAYAYHDHTHIAERRIAEHGHAVALAVRVASGKECAEAHPTLLGTPCAVALFLQLDKVLQIEIEVVVLRPYYCPVGGTILVVLSMRRQFERNLVFVEIVLNVGAESDEHRKVAGT